MSAQTELAIVPPKESALQVFKAPKGLDPYLQQIREKIDAFTPDVSTRKGRDAIASIAYSVARSKTALDNVGKELVAELKEIPKLIDVERKRMRDTLDAWQEEVRRLLTEWHAAEDARVDAHNDGIQRIKNMAVFAEPPTAAQVQQAIADLEQIEIGKSWEEFLPEAAQAKDQALASLRGQLAQRQAYEAEQAELARLRREAEERAEQDRIRQAQEAAVEQERQRVAREQQAEREAAAKREQDLLDQAAAQQRAAEQAAREAEAAAERHRLQLQLAAEQAERQAAQAKADQIAAEQRAEQERVAAAKRAEQAAEQARLDEQRRQKEAADEILRQQQAREADKAHKAKTNRAALVAFMDGGMTEECAKLAITLIAQRKIPAIAITY